MGKFFTWLFGSKDTQSQTAYEQLVLRVEDSEEDIEDLGMAGEDHDARLQAIEDFIAKELDEDVE